MADKFKGEYELGRGYPTYRGDSYGDAVGLLRNLGSRYGFVKLNFPKELWGPDAPEYELVLRRVKEDSE